MARSKQLSYMLHKCKICISCNDLLLLNAIWALRDAETFKTYLLFLGQSKLLQSFSRQPLLEVPTASVSLNVMRLIWKLTSPISDNRDAKTRCGTDYLCPDYVYKKCSMGYSRHITAVTFILINDNYTILINIKDDEFPPISLTFTQRKQKNFLLLPNSNESW